MKILRKLSSGMVAVGLALGSAGFAQQTAPVPPAQKHQAPLTPESAETKTAAAPNWTTEQIMTATVHDAWLLSGKNEATFFEIVTQLAQISATKRGVTLPETEAAGRRFGELIKRNAKADTDELLYVIVDKAVQRIGVPAKA